jgi:hypothetical protein
VVEALTVEYTPGFIFEGKSISMKNNAYFWVLMLVSSGVTSCNNDNPVDLTGATCTINCKGSGSCCSSGEQPIAEAGKLVSSCSLSSDAQNDRFADLKQTLFSKAVSSTELPDGFDFAFNDNSTMRSELERLVKFEQKCCSTAQWELQPGPEKNLVHLRIRGTQEFKSEIGTALLELTK